MQCFVGHTCESFMKRRFKRLGKVKQTGFNKVIRFLKEFLYILYLLHVVRHSK